MDDNICSICFDKLSNETSYKKWNCSHSFHQDCIISWNNGCPICRTTDLIKPNYTITGLNLGILKTFDSANNYEHYYEKWTFTNCKINNHDLKFVNSRTPPYGVLGFCKDCYLVQSFAKIY